MGAQTMLRASDVDMLKVRGWKTYTARWSRCRCSGLLPL